MIVAVGMDPGDHVGLARLVYSEQALIDTKIVQCTANCALDILSGWLSLAGPGIETYFGVERFVIGRASMRSGSPGARTRDMVGSALTLAQTHGVISAQRSASQVKEWATNGRLLAAGLEAPTKGMGHARDGARHALYTACKDARIPDPFSRKARRANG